MNPLFKAIYNHFSMTTTGALWADVSGRFYLYKAPQETTYPYIVYFPVFEETEYNFSDEHDEYTLQFNIFSKNNSSSEAGDILEDLKTTFDDCSLTVTDWRHITFDRRRTLPNNDLADVPPVFGYSVEYDCLLEKEKT